MDRKSRLKRALAAHKHQKPSAGLSAKKKSSIAKQARAGHDFGKKNVPGKTGFQAVADKAAAEYGSKAAGERVAAAAFYKKIKR